VTDTTYTNTAPLPKAIAFGGQPFRSIGVTIGEPFVNRATGETMVDCSYDYPEIITAGAGGAKPVAEWEAVAQRMTEQTIAKIDQVMAELTMHRERLVASLEAAGRAGGYE